MIWALGEYYQSQVNVGVQNVMRWYLYFMKCTNILLEKNVQNVLMLRILINR